MQEGLSAEGAYQRRRDEFGQQQLGNLANILRGVPTTDTTQTTATPPPSFASQLTGLGITGLSLAQLLGSQDKGKMIPQQGLTTILKDKMANIEAKARAFLMSDDKIGL